MNYDNMPPKVSVVMCCYNAERYVKETIDSVLNQTFQDFEFIIWNDGSTDRSKEIIEGYTDKRIRVYSDINRGEGKAAQLACGKVRAKYICRVDSDDIWLPEKLEIEYEYMETHPQVVLISCPSIYIDSNSRELGLTFPITKKSYLAKTININNRFVHSGSMYRTDIYKKTGGYKDLRLFQDWLLFNQISEYGSLALMSKPLIKYRLLPNSIMHRIEKSPYLPIIKEFQRKIIKDKGKNEEDLELFNSLYKLIGNKPDDEITNVYDPDIQNKIYQILHKIVGAELAYKTIIFLMNTFAR